MRSPRPLTAAFGALAVVSVMWKMEVRHSEIVADVKDPQPEKTRDI
jgi:hypothetical protein